MSGHHSHSIVQIESGPWVHDSYKHKEKHKEHKKHRDHKKGKERKEREKSGNHKDLSGRKRRDKIKHKHGSTDKHKHKDRKLLDGKVRKVKEDGFASPPRVKYEPDNDTDHINHHTMPKHKHTLKREGNDDNSSDFKPKKIKTEYDEKKARKRTQDDYDDGVKPKKAKKLKGEDSDGKKKVTKEPEMYKWWNEKRYTDGTKWRFLEHKGPVFAPEYEPLPNNVTFSYDEEPMKLSPEAEEVATFYAKMLDHEYITKDTFKENFFKDWRREMSAEEMAKIKDLTKCDFKEMSGYFKAQSETRKAMSREEKQKLKEDNERHLQEYGFCNMDNQKERIANFRTEPPGLFRGRGDHPKMGMLKHRIKPEDCIINCSEDSKCPEPPQGKQWKEVRHDNKVTWLVSWADNIKGSIKYIMLNPSSRVKGEKDWQKFETARQLKKCVDRIRAQYRDDWKSKEMRVRQRAVALYFIDRLALRAGNEKEEGETADTVGCCSLRVEHISLYPEKDGKEYVVEFDFLGKDCIRYYNTVPVEKRVFKNLQRFMENKQPEDDLFDRLSTNILNKHLQELMNGLTAKVFRTYNASITLQQQLKELTSPRDSIPARVLSYNRANRIVALLCNHQKAAPKTFETSMQNLQNKIDVKKDQLSGAKREAKRAKADAKEQRDEKSRKTMETKKKAVERIEEQLAKMKVQATDREENKQIALSTSKLNYLDPRISVAWCKSFNVPIEKIYNKSQRDKFACFIDMAKEDFEF